MPPQTGNEISVQNLSFAYSGTDRTVLKDITMNAASGEFICLLGPSGCGKSTFLRLLAGLERPTQGKIYIGGTEVTEPDIKHGVVFQDYGLFPWMTAGENIMLALTQRYPGRDKKELKEIALASLASVELEDSVYNALPNTLSGGMKQRCAIAQAFSTDPSVLLMDEPFGALDAVTRSLLQDLLLELCAEAGRKTVIFVTHDVDEAMLLGNRIIVLGQTPSSIICDCTIDEKTRPSRETQFENIEFIKLRSRLISQINKDVASRRQKRKEQLHS